MTPRTKKTWKWRHQRRRAGAVKNFTSGDYSQIALVQAEVAHAFRDQVLEDGVAAVTAEKGFIANKDIAGLELVGADFFDESLDWGEGFQAEGLQNVADQGTGEIAFEAVQSGPLSSKKLASSRGDLVLVAEHIVGIAVEHVRPLLSVSVTLMRMVTTPVEARPVRES